VPFGLFKKKEAEKSGTATVAPDMPQAGTLSIQDVQSLLDSIESARVQSLSSRLAPARDSAARTLASLAAIADGMEKEKLKLEELEKRFGSNIENTKKMVVSALRREASSELPQVQTLGDAKKFKERMESMIHRFGEVTGSHSKMLNYFLKKHASNMKGELCELEDLLKDAKAAISAFEQERAPAVRCSNTLNTVLQKISSARADEQAAQATQERISVIESDLARLKEELAALSSSSEFAEAKATAEKLAQAEKRQEQFNAQLAEMFSHVSRALSKYSYGVSKETERRLRVLSEEPWSALAEQDISPYSALLAEVYKSVASGQIQLKDSDRALSHLASIQSSLPQLQKDAASISAEIATLRQGKIHAVQHAREAETIIAQHEEGLARERQWLDQLKKQVAETNSEVDALLKEVSETLFSLTGKRYAVSR
jgi:chromosome segregation ATPase